jgi:hypothetical protein
MMNRTELWMATCILTLALGVGVGRAQPAKAPEPIPAPKCCTEVTACPACPVASSCCTDAVGCKQCSEPVSATKATCEGCTTGCSAVGCEECKTQAKKVKKVKHTVTPDHFMIAVPPPPPPMIATPQSVPITFFTQPPISSYTAPMPHPMPSPASVMVFRASGHKTGESGVQHAKYEFGAGKCEIELSFGTNHTAAVKHETSAGQLEIDCGGQCHATCEKMTLHLAGGQEHRFRGGQRSHRSEDAGAPVEIRFGAGQSSS